MSHDEYRGVDIRLKYDLMSDQHTLLCDTYTMIQWKFFW